MLYLLLLRSLIEQGFHELSVVIDELPGREHFRYLGPAGPSDGHDLPALQNQLVRPDIRKKDVKIIVHIRKRFSQHEADVRRTADDAQFFRQLAKHGVGDMPIVVTESGTDAPSVRADMTNSCPLKR